jgi:hypothetical protein
MRCEMVLSLNLPATGVRTGTIRQIIASAAASFVIKLTGSIYLEWTVYSHRYLVQSSAVIPRCVWMLPP